MEARLDGQAWLRILGPVEIQGCDGGLRRGGSQSRLLLALLTLSAGQVVPVADLVDGLWEERPPPSARASLQILVARLRKPLAAVPGCGIDRYGDGYQLRISPSLVDVHRFRSLVRSAQAIGDDEQAITVLSEALGLWRGPALANVPGTAMVEAIRAGLAEEHLAAVQDRFGRLLAVGRHAEAAADIPLMLVRHPLAERLAGMLMIAWYRSGRQAEALRVFRDLRGRLASELGVEPGAELQRLHQQILSADPALAAPNHHARLGLRGAGAATSAGGTQSTGLAPPTGQRRPVAAPEQVESKRADGLTRLPSNPGSASGHANGLHQQPMPSDVVLASRGNGTSNPASTQAIAIPVVPRQLPAAPAKFAGRQRELAALTGCLDAGAGREAPVILAISGIPGVGKTALGVHWAHQVRERFPDGQFYVNLRGFGLSQAPVTPAEAINVFLESLGVGTNQLSRRLETRAGLYRSLLAGKRMLIVLDNARDEAQVRPLLPGSPTCAVLITSRNELTGLVAAEAARLLVLDVLSEPEARQLLASRLGAGLAAEADAVSEVISLCGRLPLALAIAAARATRPARPLASLAAELQGIRHRLDQLDAGDKATSVRAVFSWSYRLLSEPAARLFRLLGALSGPDISVAAAASLAGVSVPSVHAALSELVRQNLVQEQAAGRFGLHDLIHAYAASLGADNERHSARRRVLDHYLHSAHAAVGRLYPAVRQIAIPPPGPGTTPEQPADPGEAMAWLQAEHQALQAATAMAADGGFDDHAWKLPAVLQEYFARRGHYHDWAKSQQTALAAAARLSDEAARASAHWSLGEALIQLGSRDDARRHLYDALKLYGNLGDHGGQASCHCGMARLSLIQGDHARALHHAQRALQQYRAAGDMAGQAAALNGVGWDYALLGNNQRALSYCRKALELYREAGNRFGEAATLDSLGYCHHQAGRHDQAVAFYQQALHAYTDVGDRYYFAHTLIRLGDTHTASGDQQAASQVWQQALEILDDLHHHDAEAVRAKLQGMTERRAVGQPGGDLPH
jgi:DNA-binding SARP family transcriptional activator/tetratricopeptide (TPR) repeat protein